MARRLCQVVLLAIALVMAAGAHAHMPAGYDLRAIHFLQDADGLHGYFRLTFPLVVANGVGAKRADGFFEPPPFTVLRIESALAFYYTDVERIRAEPLELARWVARGHRLESEGREIEPRILLVRVYPKGSVPPFNDLAQARSATQAGDTYPVSAPAVDAAFAMVDLHLLYPNSAEEFTLSSSLDNRVIGQPEIQNLIVDHRPGGDIIYRIRGALNQPVRINPSRWSAVRGFVAHGAEHVLSGADHLMLILCLTLGATGLASLAWRVTGFTLGHTVSLILGFWGYVPTAVWFVPVVEATIALSIVLAGLSLVSRNLAGRSLFITVVMVGFVHGLGFSFGLREMLDVKGPHVWLSLAAFNLGVELGQLVFAVLVLVIFVSVCSRHTAWKPHVLRLTAGSSMLVGSYWMFERLRPLLA